MVYAAAPGGGLISDGMPLALTSLRTSQLPQPAKKGPILLQEELQAHGVDYSAPQKSRLVRARVERQSHIAQLSTWARCALPRRAQACTAPNSAPDAHARALARPPTRRAGVPPALRAGLRHALAAELV